MTTFDEREKAFKKKFAIDQELKFKAEVRCHRLLAEWAAGKLCLADKSSRGLPQGCAQGGSRE